MNKILVGILASISLVFSGITAYAAVPQTISYQGYLTNSSGSPVTGKLNLTFSLYAAPSGADPALWTELHADVDVLNGVYTVVLGNAAPTPSPINIAFDRQYWLGVTIGSDPELSPRQPLTSVPYAMRAGKTDDISLACPENSVLVYRSGWQCGAVSMLPNGAGVCSQGNCVASTCAQGYGDCDGNGSTGCEAGFQTDINNCGSCGHACSSGLCESGKCNSSFSASFIQGVAPTIQHCTDWNNFRAGINASMTYNSVTIKGSFSATGVTCTGSAANTLCQALRTGSQTGLISCDGRSWAVDTCGSGLEITADGTLCYCDAGAGYVARPCNLGSPNWGGANTAVCGAPSQTISVICSE